MDTVVLVDDRISDGQQLLDRLVADGFEVSVMFWVKTGDEGLWHLYLVSSWLKAKGLGETYEGVYSSLSKLVDSPLTLAQIKVISPDSPIAKDVFDILRKSTRRSPIRSARPHLGRMAVDEVYIYPEPPGVRARDAGIDLGRVKLTSDVEQTPTWADVLAPFTGDEERDYKRLTANGWPPAQADLWVRQERQSRSRRPPIPAGAVVKAVLKAWYGDRPEDDPDPLILVEDDSGAQGITHKSNTEPAP